MSLRPGQSVGRYLIIDRIGAGGMAEVFRANFAGEWGYRKQVVLKMILPHLATNPDYVQMFLDEGRITAGLSHPNLPQSYELGMHDGRHYIAMEYVSGVSMWQVLQRLRERRIELPLAVTLRVMSQLLECLHYVHGVTDDEGRPLRIVHRDVSPGNLVITDDGAMKLLDFGIARARVREHQTAIGVVKGKMGFMSPEQARGEPVDHRTDIYAVGTLLYLLTVGVAPFEHLNDVYAVLDACASGNIRAPRKLKPELDAGLERIILKALSTKAIDRYATAGSMLDAVEAFALQQRIVPSSRAAATFMREVFPERSADARTLDGSALAISPIIPTATTVQRPARVSSAPTSGSRPSSPPAALPPGISMLSEDSSTEAGSIQGTTSSSSSTVGGGRPVDSLSEDPSAPPSFGDEKTVPAGDGVRGALQRVPRGSPMRFDDDTSPRRWQGGRSLSLREESSSSTSPEGFAALTTKSLTALVAAGIVALVLLIAAVLVLARSSDHAPRPTQGQLREYPKSR
jgi:serine/threonine-protein kinase